MSNDNLPQQFTKKPVTVEAIQWTGKLACLDAFNIPELHQTLDSSKVGIPTMEGTMIASVGDWIIKGVKGEFYPCKPDIFAMTYEAGKRDAVAAASGAGVPAGLRNAFMTMESTNDRSRSLVLKFNQREDCYAVHDFLLKFRNELAAAPTHDSDGGAVAQVGVLDPWPCSFPVGYAMKHRIGIDVGFSWDKNDPKFDANWERIPMVPQSTPSLARAVQQGGSDAVDAARWRYVRDTETLETAVWEALEGTDCAPGGVLDKVAYAHGMDTAVDRAIAAMQAQAGDAKGTQ